MRLLILSSSYPAYLEKFYATRPWLGKKSHAEQKKELDYDYNSWATCWAETLAPLGYEVMEVPVNNRHLQKAWAIENGLNFSNQNEIAIEQIRQFQPEILWFNHLDENLLGHIRSTVGSIKFVLGWVGSAITKTDVWRHMDLVLTCAPESVNRLQEQGLRSKHLDHGFYLPVNDRLEDKGKSIDLSFIGQIIRKSQFHLEREYLLRELSTRIDIRIYSAIADIKIMDHINWLLTAGAYSLIKALKYIGIGSETLAALPKVGTAAHWSEMPKNSMIPELKPFINSAVFGLEMFQVIKDSRITLNIHADSSPTHASNMRLFETTGVGTCLVTDWKENVDELFEPEKEIVTYKTVEECVEKVQWLLNNQKECREIAKAGQERCLRDHSFEKRAEQLDSIIKRELL